MICRPVKAMVYYFPRLISVEPTLIQIPRGVQLFHSPGNLWLKNDSVLGFWELLRKHLIGRIDTVTSLYFAYVFSVWVFSIRLKSAVVLLLVETLKQPKLWSEILLPLRWSLLSTDRSRSLSLLKKSLTTPRFLLRGRFVLTYPKELCCFYPLHAECVLAAVSSASA